MPLVNWSSNLQNVIALTHADAAEIVATQLKKQVKHVQVRDLTAAISDIQLEWTVQGSPFLKVMVIDPAFQLLTSRFIDVDDAGMLVPLEVRYPTDSDCYWWLCALDATQVMDGPNLTLTFEDRITTQMRDVAGPLQSNPGETRADFIRRAVSKVQGVRFWCPTTQDEIRAAEFVGLPKMSIVSGQNVPTAASNPVSSPPTSSTAPGASPQRRNPTKASHSGRGGRGGGPKVDVGGGKPLGGRGGGPKVDVGGGKSLNLLIPPSEQHNFG